MFGYDLIVADVPATFELRSAKGEAKSPQAHYDCMTLDELKALPVGHLCGVNTWLLYWTCAPLLREAFDVVEAWGFEYRTRFSWAKRTKNGRPAIGPGYIVRSRHEDILVCAIGSPRYAKPLDSLFDGVRREHSRKPEEFYKRVEAFAPKARRCDLFARASRPGWDTWGREATKFDAPIGAAEPAKISDPVYSPAVPGDLLSMQG